MSECETDNGLFTKRTKQADNGTTEKTVSEARGSRSQRSDPMGTSLAVQYSELQHKRVSARPEQSEGSTHDDYGCSRACAVSVGRA